MPSGAHAVSGDPVPELAVLDAVMLRCRDDRVCWAALFNAAFGRKGMYLGAAVVELMGNALREVKAWPTA